MILGKTTSVVWDDSHAQYRRTAGHIKASDDLLLNIKCSWILTMFWLLLKK